MARRGADRAARPRSATRRDLPARHAPAGRLREPQPEWRPATTRSSAARSRGSSARRCRRTCPRSAGSPTRTLALRDVRLLDAAALGECDGGRGDRASGDLRAARARAALLHPADRRRQRGRRAGRERWPAAARARAAAAAPCTRASRRIRWCSAFSPTCAPERRRPAARGGAFAAHATAALRALALADRAARAADERRAEQHLGGDRRAHRAQGLSQDPCRAAAGTRDRAFPRRGRLPEHPGAAGLRRVRAAGRRADGGLHPAALRRRAAATAGASRWRPGARLAGPTPAGKRVRRLGAPLGVRTAELHRAFATPGGGAAFEPEPTTRADLDAWVAQARETAQARARHAGRRPERVPEAQRADAAALRRPAGRDPRPHRRAAARPGGDQDPLPRRLPPRPSAGRRRRLHDRGLRGRARPRARGAAAQVVPVARRGRHAALVRLRGARAVHGGPASSRARSAWERAPSRRSWPATARRSRAAARIPPIRRTRRRCSTCSRWRKRSTRCPTSWRTGPRGCAYRWREFVPSSTAAQKAEFEAAVRTTAHGHDTGPVERRGTAPDRDQRRLPALDVLRHRRRSDDRLRFQPAER